MTDLQTLVKPATEPRMHVLTRPTRWIAPREHTSKINVDAALPRNSSFRAIAAVCRDFKGNFWGATTITLTSVDDPATLEALAVRESLPLADDLYERRIYVASDCKTVIDYKAEERCSVWSYY